MRPRPTLPPGPRPDLDARPFVLPVVLLGIGFGGFVDGIVFHQVLQWHHMASAVEPPLSLEALRLNTVLDGLFHAATWVITLLGAVLLFGAAGIARARPPRGLLLGGLLTGWALFNLVEGIVNHHLLGLHHVREGPDAGLYDAAFLVVSALLFLVGSAVLRRAVRAGDPAVTSAGE
jgi:uncharacterized membrane protein